MANAPFPSSTPSSLLYALPTSLQATSRGSAQSCILTALHVQSICMLTPSGRFEPNTNLCLSMTDFHPESWSPSVRRAWPHTPLAWWSCHHFLYVILPWCTHHAS